MNQKGVKKGPNGLKNGPKTFKWTKRARNGLKSAIIVDFVHIYLSTQRSEKYHISE